MGDLMMIKQIKGGVSVNAVYFLRAKYIRRASQLSEISRQHNQILRQKSMWSARISVTMQDPDYIHFSLHPSVEYSHFDKVHKSSTESQRSSGTLVWYDLVIPMHVHIVLCFIFSITNYFLNLSNVCFKLCLYLTCLLYTSRCV